MQSRIRWRFRVQFIDFPAGLFLSLFEMVSPRGAFDDFIKRKLGLTVLPKSSDQAFIKLARSLMNAETWS